jgi:uridine kinase
MTTYLIGISGPSCAGKTRLAVALNKALAPQGSALLSVDNYYRDLSDLPPERRAGVNFDAPEAIEHELLLEHLHRLYRGHPVETPTYDFTRHCRAPQRGLITPSRYVIVEGLLALHWEEMRALMALKVFVHVEEGVSFARRLQRDAAERGRSPESVRTQFSASVQPMYERYIAPTLAYADLALDGSRDTEVLLAEILKQLPVSRDTSAENVTP